MPALSDRWKILKGGTDKDGYKKIILCNAGKRRHARVHVLVLEAFVGPCPAGMIGCHFPDPDRSNNKLANLKWGTQKENVSHQEIHGTRLRGDAAPGHILVESQVKEIRRTYARGGCTQLQLASTYGVSLSTINFVVTRRNWRHVS